MQTVSSVGVLPRVGSPLPFVGSPQSVQVLRPQSLGISKHLKKAKSALIGAKQQEKLTKEQEQDIKEVFYLFDEDESGELDFKELEIGVRILGFEADREEIKQMLEDMDNDGSGTISYEEFQKMMEHKILSGHSKVYWHKFVKKSMELANSLRSDEGHQQRINALLQYARAQVDRHLPSIWQNMQRMGITALDILWPGAGYNSVACGGNFEVLTLLEKRGLLKVGRIMGSSGGACSTVLALADPTNSSHTLLHCYLVGESYMHQSGDAEIRRASPIWAALYSGVLHDDEAFRRLQERGYVAVWSGRRSFTYNNQVLYNFETREQCALCFHASGELSFKLLSGHNVPGITEYIGKLCDGGCPTHFRESCTPLLYMNTFYGFDKSMTGHTMSLTKDSIDELFKAGVDETIRLLVSEDLWLDKDKHGNGGAAIVRPQPGQYITAEDCERLYSEYSYVREDADFWNCREHCYEYEEEDSETESCLPWPCN